ncbi:unnamed protein product, partial [Prorocentrum cordatum]
AMATNEGDLQAEKDYLKDIKPDCDWIIDNAPERRAKRRAELDGLNAAKAYLVGYKEDPFSPRRPAGWAAAGRHAGRAGGALRRRPAPGGGGRGVSELAQEGGVAAGHIQEGGAEVRVSPAPLQGGGGRRRGAPAERPRRGP